METSIENAYTTGAMVRDQEWQAVISAGDGGAAALDILSKEKGEHFHDFDTPADAEWTINIGAYRILYSLIMNSPEKSALLVSHCHLKPCFRNTGRHVVSRLHLV
jgi:hypothetical protein